MAFAEKRGKGDYPWRVKYKTPTGEWTSESGFPGKRAAENFGKDQEAAVREGRWVDPKKARTLFRDWVPVWMAAQNVRPGTAALRRSEIKNLLMPGFGDTPLREINLFGAKAWANRQTGHARVTVDHALTLLSMILSGAADAGYIAANPLAGRRRGTGRGPADVREEQAWAEPAHIGRIADRMAPPNALMVITAAFTGLRWGELAGLHRDNCLLPRPGSLDGAPFARLTVRVDPLVGALHKDRFERTEDEAAQWREAEEARLARAAVEGRAVREKLMPASATRLYLGPPKNPGSARFVDLPPFLAVLLEEHLRGWPHSLVFAGTRGGWHRSGEFVRRYLRPAADGRPASPMVWGHPAREAWDPVLPGLTMRGLRHTHDTWMKEDGVDRALRFETMGWKAADIEGVYEHVTPKMRKMRLDALDARWVRARRGTRWDPLRKPPRS